jgi:hypothetical protein
VLCAADTVAPEGAVCIAALFACFDTPLESAADVAGRTPLRWKRSGGATMTIAVSSNARKKRLSIVGSAWEIELLRVPDRIRRDGMGGTARCGGLRASYLVAHRGARALR